MAPPYCIMLTAKVVNSGKEELLKVRFYDGEYTHTIVITRACTMVTERSRGQCCMYT